MVNDISGFEYDRELGTLVAERKFAELDRVFLRVTTISSKEQ